MDRLKIHDESSVLVTVPKLGRERLNIRGRFVLVCTDRYGHVVWRDETDNVVTTVGKNLVLDSSLAGSGYTTTGPYMGLIGATSFTGVAVGDTMSSHAGWVECGTSAPTYTGNRIVCAWNAASAGSKALAAALQFNFTNSGTVQGLFVVLGSGASAAKDSTGGTLLSAAVLGGGAQAVQNTFQLAVSYSLTL